MVWTSSSLVETKKFILQDLARFLQTKVYLVRSCKKKFILQDLARFWKKFLQDDSSSCKILPESCKILQDKLFFRLGFPEFVRSDQKPLQSMRNMIKTKRSGVTILVWMVWSEIAWVKHLNLGITKNFQLFSFYFQYAHIALTVRRVQEYVRIFFLGLLCDLNEISFPTTWSFYYRWVLSFGLC